MARYKFDNESLFFNVLRKTNCNWISPEDLLPVLEGITDLKLATFVSNHTL